MAAARLADVAAGDPHPLVRDRVGKHPLQELPVAGLDQRALVERDAGLADPGGEVVTDALQLTEVEHTRLRRAGGYRAIQLDPWKGLGEETGELLLEPTDLAPQLGAGEPLVSIETKRGERLSFA